MRKFTSTDDIGDKVTIYLAGIEIEAEIQAVTFTEEKVWYDVLVELKDGMQTCFHMIDSAILEP